MGGLRCLPGVGSRTHLPPEASCLASLAALPGAAPRMRPLCPRTPSGTVVCAPGCPGARAAAQCERESGCRPQATPGSQPRKVPEPTKGCRLCQALLSGAAGPGTPNRASFWSGRTHMTVLMLPPHPGPPQDISVVSRGVPASSPSSAAEETWQTAVGALVRVSAEESGTWSFWTQRKDSPTKAGEIMFI